MDRKCLQCGKSLIKRKFESKKRFGKKKFCSSDCSHIYMKEHKMGWWSTESKEKDYYPEDYTWL